MKFQFEHNPEKNSEEYLELNEKNLMPQEEEPTKIVIENLKNFIETDRILKNLRNGHVVFVRIKELRDSNMDELKHAITKMKTVCRNFDGDIAGVEEEWLILAPKHVRINR